MNCCEVHNIDCRQGDDCPMRLACRVRQTATPLDTGTSAANAIDDTRLMLGQGIALLIFIVSVIVYASL